MESVFILLTSSATKISHCLNCFIDLPVGDRIWQDEKLFKYMDCIAISSQDITTRCGT